MSDRIQFWVPQVDEWLNANDRRHWAPESRIKRNWRQLGKAKAQEKRLPKLLERVEVTVWVHKTTGRKYDAMNLYPTFKAFVDGLVDYGLVEDDDNAHMVGPLIFAGAKHSEAGATICIRRLVAQEPA